MWYLPSERGPSVPTRRGFLATSAKRPIGELGLALTTPVPLAIPMDEGPSLEFKSIYCSTIAAIFDRLWPIEQVDIFGFFSITFG